MCQDPSSRVVCMWDTVYPALMQLERKAYLAHQSEIIRLLLITHARKHFFLVQEC